MGSAIVQQRERIRLGGHYETVTGVAFSPDGARLATGGVGDNTAVLWDIKTGAEIVRLTGHEYWVTSVAFSPDGKRLATGSADGTARLWDAGTGAQIAWFTGHGHSVSSVAFSPDGTRLATGSLDGTARLWDAETGAEIARLEGHEGSVNSVAFSPDGTRLATGSADNIARLWDVEATPKGNAFEVACALLPVANGVKLDDLSAALQDQAIQIDRRVCEDPSARPLPWWMTPGAEQPQPPPLPGGNNSAETLETSN